MGSMNQLDLSLSGTTSTTLKPSYVPKTITNLLNDLADIDGVSKKMTVLNEYLCQHMEELSSVEYFKRKLPQCMLLLLDAIEVIKDEILKLEKGKESATESSSAAAERYFSEFLLRKRNDHTKMTEEKKYQASSSANPHQAYDEEDEGKEKETMEKEDQGKGKEIMEKDDGGDDGDDDEDESGGLGGGAGSRADEEREYPRVVIRSKRPDGDSNRKLMQKNIIPKINENYPIPNEPLIEQVLFPEPNDPCWRNMSRRYWTPHLHATFLEALNVLGGPEVATPKQIREIMHIEDLTNDQVKSHLQKYRLHNRGLLFRHAANGNDHMAGPHYNCAPGTYNRGPWIPGASQFNYRPRQPPARRNAGAYNDGGSDMEIDESNISDGPGWFQNFKRSMGPDA